ncbi:MAG TPA: YbjN domain-containing protein [Candidatus Ozemobacteraceae bacterium]|nr:YbjN domain-containing protein [Candidatus Ozemobacteraceae bacterium]HQG27000.1 YbjN domain-containing protein [Candidatus Ozemobacteraceae bacterium]
MKQDHSSKDKDTPQASAWEIEIIKSVAKHLTDEGYRFQYLSDACLELYLQGKNLTMRMLIYAHNRHLVVRVPGFIRNVELRRLDLLMTLMQLMDEYFDIRFELAKDGQSLSAACTHIVEDGTMTKAQCMQTMMVVAYIVDDTYPKLMHILYGTRQPVETGDAIPVVADDPEPGDPGDGEEDDDPGESEDPSGESSSGRSTSGHRRGKSPRHDKVN